MTIFEQIKKFNINEMAEFIRSIVEGDGEVEVACYGCINYGTHHSDPEYKGTNLYECEGCCWEGIGYDIAAWLNADVCKEDYNAEAN